MHFDVRRHWRRPPFNFAKFAPTLAHRQCRRKLPVKLQRSAMLAALRANPELAGSLLGVAVGFVVLVYAYFCCGSARDRRPALAQSNVAIKTAATKMAPQQQQQQQQSAGGAAKAPRQRVDEFEKYRIEGTGTRDTDPLASGTFKLSAALGSAPFATHPRLFSTLKGHQGFVTAIAFSGSGKFLATCAEDGSVRVWRDLVQRNSAPSFMLSLRSQYATAAAFVQDKYLVLATSDTRQLQYYELHVAGAPIPPASLAAASTAHLHLRSEVPHGHSAPVKYLTFAPGTWRFGFTCARGTADTQLRVINARGELRHALKTNQMLNYQARLSSNGQFVAVATKMADVKVLSVEYEASGEFKALAPACQLRNHKHGVCDVAFSGDGRTCVTGAGNGKWRVFNIGVRWRDGEEAACLATHDTPFAAVEFVDVHPAAARDLVAVASEQTVHLCRLSTGAVIDTITCAHAGRLTCIQFSPCGQFLVTAGADRCVRLWEVRE